MITPFDSLVVNVGDDENMKIVGASLQTQSIASSNEELIGRSLENIFHVDNATRFELKNPKIGMAFLIKLKKQTTSMQIDDFKLTIFDSGIPSVRILHLIAANISTTPTNSSTQKFATSRSLRRKQSKEEQTQYRENQSNNHQQQSQTNIYQSILANAADAIFVANEQGEIICINDSTRDMFGFFNGLDPKNVSCFRFGFVSDFDPTIDSPNLEYSTTDRPFSPSVLNSINNASAESNFLQRFVETFSPAPTPITQHTNQNHVGSESSSTFSSIARSSSLGSSSAASAFPPQSYAAAATNGLNSQTQIMQQTSSGSIPITTVTSVTTPALAPTPNNQNINNTNHKNTNTNTNSNTNTNTTNSFLSRISRISRALSSTSLATLPTPQAQHDQHHLQNHGQHALQFHSQQHQHSQQPNTQQQQQQLNGINLNTTIIPKKIIGEVLATKSCGMRFHAELSLSISIDSITKETIYTGIIRDISERFEREVALTFASDAIILCDWYVVESLILLSFILIDFCLFYFVFSSGTDKLIRTANRGVEKIFGFNEKGIFKMKEK